MYTTRLVSFIVVIVLAGLAWSDKGCEEPFFDSKDPVVIARAGGLKIWPENTLYAFERAMKLGVDAIEMDVRMTKDEKLVLMQDETVDRTTDGHGKVEDLTLAQIQALDAGYGFTDAEGRTPYRGQGITVPTVKDVFTALPKTQMVIEMKEGDKKLADLLAKAIEQYGRTKQFLVGSRNEKLLERFRELAPQVATVATRGEVQWFVVAHKLHLGATYKPKACVFQVPEHTEKIHLVTDKFIHTAHDTGIEVCVWTINDPNDARRLVSLGVDGVVTDDPAAIVKVLRSEDSEEE